MKAFRDELNALVGTGERWGWIFRCPALPGQSPLRQYPPQASNADYLRQYESWRAKVIADEKRSQQAYEHVPLLWPSGPISRQAMISVFGGTAPGVKALLATLGSSLLGMQQVTIINLADSHAADPLIQLAELCGMPAQVDAISPAGSSFDPLAYLAADELVTTVISVLYDDPHDPAAAAGPSVLRKIARNLQDRPLTLRRLHEGVRAALLEDIELDSAALSSSESKTLQSLYGREARERGGIVAQLVDLEHRLDELTAFVGRGQLGMSPIADYHPFLHVIQVASSMESSDFRSALALTLQSVIHQARLAGNTQSGGTAIILGADKISDYQIRSVAAAIAGTRLQLVLLFEHVRDRAPVALAAGSSVVFMTSPSHSDAVFAADLLGPGRIITLSPVTQAPSARSRTAWEVSQEPGLRLSYGPLFFQASSTRADNDYVILPQSGPFGVWSTASANSPARKHPVRPDVLQHLPHTALLIPAEGDAPPIVLDCNPNIVTFPRVARPYER